MQSGKNVDVYLALWGGGGHDAVSNVFHLGPLPAKPHQCVVRPGEGPGSSPDLGVSSNSGEGHIDRSVLLLRWAGMAPFIERTVCI